MNELGALIRHSPWAYPALEITHIAGFVVLVGSVLVFDLRVLGLGQNIGVRELARLTLPFSISALLLVIPSGLLLFLSDATAILTNPAFQMKLGLLGLAGLNAAAFHLGPYQSVSEWDRLAPAPWGGRLGAAASLLLWLSVIAAGRFIAYV